MRNQRLFLWMLTCLAPWLGLQAPAQANGTVRFEIAPAVFNVSYSAGRPLTGNTTFTPRVWHEDKPSGPFNTCVKAYRVNIFVAKLLYPFRLPTDADWYASSYYDIGTPETDRTYEGLCIFNPTDMQLWDHKFDPFPNSILTPAEAANFCSRVENQGRKHSFSKTVNAVLMHKVGTDLVSSISAGNVADHKASQSVNIHLSCDCSPLLLSGPDSDVIYRTENQNVRHDLLNVATSTAVPPIQASLSAGKLPPGMDLKLASSSGKVYLEGVPEAEGDFRFTVSVKDACPLERSQSRDLSLAVRCAALNFTTPRQLPDATLNKPYTQDIRTSCSPTHESLRFELLGELPRGLTLSPEGQITGSPATEAASYFYVSVTGQERGARKEIHQRFDLNVTREVPVLPAGERPGNNAGGPPRPPLSSAPEILGVPATCHTGEVLTVSYKGLSPMPGFRMGMVGAGEGGNAAAVGSKAAPGTSGSLTFSAPTLPGTYLFRIFDKDGRTVASSAAFKATARIVVPLAPGAVGPGSAGGRPPVTSAPQRPDALPEQRPATPCAGSTLLKGLEGYKIDNCVKRHDEARMLIEPDPGSPANLVLEGEKTTVIYEWPLAGSSASIAQVKRHYMNEARQLGATVIADRGGYVVFEITQSGTKVYVSVDVFNDGQTIHLVAITPEVVTRR